MFGLTDAEVYSPSKQARHSSMEEMHGDRRLRPAAHAVSISGSRG